MPKFRMLPTTGDTRFLFTAMLGTLTGPFKTTEVGKLVKLVAESRYDLVAAGDEIEGSVVATEVWTAEGFSMGTVQNGGRLPVEVVGGAAIGDYVVADAPTPLGVANPAMPKVKKGTPTRFLWRIVSMPTPTSAVIERI